jgi:hypothetical protein
MTEVTKNGAEQLTLTVAQIALIVKIQTEPEPLYEPKSVIAQRPGWSLKLIDAILGDCDLYPRGGSGYRVQLYSMTRVALAEKYLRYLEEEEAVKKETPKEGKKRRENLRRAAVGSRVSPDASQAEVDRVFKAAGGNVILQS